MIMFFTHVRDNFAAAFFPRLSEWFAAIMLMALGFMLSSNPDLMSSAKTGVYQLLLMIATQETWSMAMKLFAACRLVILLINGAWRRSPHLRSLSAFMTCFFWTQIALSAMQTFGYVFVFSAGILLLDFANSIRAARDARIIDHAYRKGGQEGGSN
jgi:hypothetical protein